MELSLDNGEKTDVVEQSDLVLRCGCLKENETHKEFYGDLRSIGKFDDLQEWHLFERNILMKVCI